MSDTLKFTPSKPGSVKLSGAPKEVIRCQLREVILAIKEEHELQKLLSEKIKLEKVYPWLTYLSESEERAAILSEIEERLVLLARG